MKRVILLLPMLAMLGACALPGEGPTTDDILSSAEGKEAQKQFSVIALDPPALRTIATQPLPGAPEERAPLPPARPIGLIGPGDRLQVFVWEIAATMRATPAGGQADNRPSVNVTTRVERDGTLTLPFIGRVAAAGLRPSRLEALLAQRYGQQMINPQVSVLVEEDQTNSVILAGEVAHPGRQPLTYSARRLLDLLALGGGARLPADKALVRVERGQGSMTRSLARVQAEPALNVALGAGDVVSVLPLNRRFYAFGAVNRPGEQEFPAETQSLLQALGRIAGLQDMRADRTGLFIYRRQPEALTQRLLPEGQQAHGQVIYHLNMRDPNAFFLAAGFPVWPEDVIFVSNAPIADFSKVLSLVTGLGSVAATPRNFGLAP